MTDQQTQEREPFAVSRAEEVNEGKNGEVVLKNEQLDISRHGPGPGLPVPVVVVENPQRRWPFTMKDVLTLLVQLVNVTAALVFGVWAIRSYDAALQAVILAEAANTLTMFQICQSNVDDFSVRLFHCFYRYSRTLLTA